MVERYLAGIASLFAMVVGPSQISTVNPVPAVKPIAVAVNPVPFDPLSYLCTADGRGSAGRLPFASFAGAQFSATKVALRADSPAPAVCTAPPTDYQSLPSVTGPGDVKVDLDLGIGPGVGVDNASLCFRNGSLPAAPVVRIKQGNRLTIHHTGFS